MKKGNKQIIVDFTNLSSPFLFQDTRNITDQLTNQSLSQQTRNCLHKNIIVFSFKHQDIFDKKERGCIRRCNLFLINHLKTHHVITSIKVPLSTSRANCNIHTRLQAWHFLHRPRLPARPSGSHGCYRSRSPHARRRCDVLRASGDVRCRLRFSSVRLPSRLLPGYAFLRLPLPCSVPIPPSSVRNRTPEPYCLLLFLLHCRNERTYKILLP